jgi:hypothetical protein
LIGVVGPFFPQNAVHEAELGILTGNNNIYFYFFYKKYRGMDVGKVSLKAA